LEVVLPARTNEDTNAQHAIFGSGTSGHGIRIGYNSANNIGFVSALKPLVAWSHLQLEGSSIRFASTGTERVRVTTDGLTFNGDTAAANALDDYEEGTWDVVLTPSTSGTITLNPSFNTGQYTKIGRQVTVTCLAVVSSVSSPVGTTLFLEGFPFTVGDAANFRGSAGLSYFNSPVHEPNQLSNILVNNTDRININIDTSTLAGNDEFLMTCTYFV
jgi:hypothetical protein